jgi:hypothetical protein
LLFFDTGCDDFPGYPAMDPTANGEAEALFTTEPASGFHLRFDE